jgi:hypothetical protein
MALKPNVAEVRDRLEAQLDDAGTDAGAGRVAEPVEELETMTFAFRGLTTLVVCR